MPYRYSMLRFVPSPARGEFINIGAIAGDDDSGDWELRIAHNLRRAKAIDDEGRLGIALGFVDVAQEHIAALDQLPITGREPMSTKMLELWAEEMQNVVRWSAPAPVVAESAEAALDLVFPELVVEPTTRHFRFEKKHRALSSTKRAYRDHHVPDSSIEAHAAITSGPYDKVFDFAVFNGRVVQLVQCWSFQLPNQDDLAEEVKAWAWVVHELRKQGGVMRLAERALEIPQHDVEIASVYVPPTEDQGEARAFDEAREAFEEVGVIRLTADEADAVGRSAAARLNLTA